MLSFQIPLLLKIEMISVPMLVWALYIGIALGILTMYYNKSVLGKAVRAILKEGAIDEGNAKSAEVLGFAQNPLILRAIEKGVLSRYIRRKKGADGTTLYYITEEDRIRAELRYSNKGSDLYVVIIALVLFLMVAFLAARYLPELLDMAGDIIT